MTEYRRIKFAAATIAIMLGGGISYYFFSSHKQEAVAEGPVYNFNDERDTEDVLQLFLKDWKWLSTRDYSEERLRFMLKTHSPNEFEQRYFGKMHIKVLREQDHFVGFITYYMKNAFDGHILFLAIEPEFRGKRYAHKLIDFAKKDLKNMGAKFITLLTRITNEKGLKLYRREGFQETTDNEFVYFSMPA